MMVEHEFIDYAYLASAIASLSMSGVISDARSGSPRRFSPKRWFLLYDILQVFSNLFVFMQLTKAFGGVNFFGFSTSAFDRGNYMKAMRQVYMIKWLDIGFLSLQELAGAGSRRKSTVWFHHLTMAPLLHYVMTAYSTTFHPAYAFSFLINSAAQTVVYFYMGMRAYGYDEKLMKKVVYIAQFTECALVILHTAYAFFFVTWIPKELCLLCLGYSVSSLVLHWIDIVIANKAKIIGGSFGGKELKRKDSETSDEEKMKNRLSSAVVEDQKKKDDHDVVKKVESISESNKSKKKKPLPPCYIRIGDKQYDCTSFAPRHPGGKIINEYHGVDATDAFEAFHGDSKHAYKVLSKMPVGEFDIKVNEENLDAEFKEFIRKNFYNRWSDKVKFVIYALSVVGVLLAGLQLALMGWILSGGILMGVAWAHCGFVMHHAGHVAFSGKRSIDFPVQSMFFGLFVGASARWWRNRHNKHHAMPNKIGVDGDLNTTPFFAWDPVLAEKCPSFLLKVQHYLFFPLLTMYSMVFFVSTKVFMWRRKYLDEFGLIILHYALATYFFYGHFDRFLYSYLIGYAIEGVYLGFFFGLNHFAEERVEDVHTSWVRWQSQASLNWGCGSYFYLILSGFLHLQIEHHVFPQCPPFAYYDVQKHLQAYCEKKNIPYRDATFYDATCKLFDGMKATAKEVISMREGKQKEE